MDLVRRHYRREMTLRYLPVRYEDIVADQETHVRKMLSFVGAPFDKRCLDFHENRRYARTASYAQVTEKLYDRSRYRYRAYLKELAPVLPILEPTIFALGNTRSIRSAVRKYSRSHPESSTPSASLILICNPLRARKERMELLRVRGSCCHPSRRHAPCMGIQDVEVFEGVASPSQ